MSLLVTSGAFADLINSGPHTTRIYQYIRLESGIYWFLFVLEPIPNLPNKPACEDERNDVVGPNPNLPNKAAFKDERTDVVELIPSLSNKAVCKGESTDVVELMIKDRPDNKQDANLAGVVNLNESDLLLDKRLKLFKSAMYKRSKNKCFNARQ